jgi:succinate dehydrogenase / fumarate reductase, cytochrome b subunit
MANNNKRPVFLDLTRIHLPVTAVLSIGHRITGVLLILLIPLLVFLFDRSLAGEQGYDFVVGLLQGDAFRALLLLGIWLFAHHFLAGIRYLLIDLDIGVDVRSARISAWIVLAGGVFTLFVAALVLR